MSKDLEVACILFTRLFQVLRRVLQKSTDHRTPKDIEVIIPILREIQFFKDRDLKEHELAEMCQALNYLYIPKNQIVFDIGTRFLLMN